jgi:hypothetical protein
MVGIDPEQERVAFSLRKANLLALKLRGAFDVEFARRKVLEAAMRKIIDMAPADSEIAHVARQAMDAPGHIFDLEELKQFVDDAVK